MKKNDDAPPFSLDVTDDDDVTDEIWSTTEDGILLPRMIEMNAPLCPGEYELTIYHSSVPTTNVIGKHHSENNKIGLALSCFSTTSGRRHPRSSLMVTQVAKTGANAHKCTSICPYDVLVSGNGYPLESHSPVEATACLARLSRPLRLRLRHSVMYDRLVLDFGFSEALVREALADVVVVQQHDHDHHHPPTGEAEVMSLAANFCTSRIS